MYYGCMFELLTFVSKMAKRQAKYWKPKINLRLAVPQAVSFVLVCFGSLKSQLCIWHHHMVSFLIYMLWFTSAEQQSFPLMKFMPQ